MVGNVQLRDMGAIEMDKDFDKIVSTLALNAFYSDELKYVL